MTYRLKSFIELSSAISDTPSTIAPFGEISTHCLTYSRNKKTYVNSAEAASNTLIAFLSQDNTGTIDVPLVIRDKIFEITQWLQLNQKSVNAYTTKNSLIDALTNQFVTSVTSLYIGELIQDSTNTLFPEWISFTQLGIVNTSYSANEIKVWYANESFKNQYDENELVVIPPIVVIDDLFAANSIVSTRLNAFKNVDLLNAIQTAKGTIPETSILSENFIWKDPTDLTNVDKELNTNWTVLVYGRIDDNNDYVKNAIRNYISANTIKTELEWKAILPDIYKNTEFLIYPKWQNFAIHERLLQVGQFSPVVNLKKELDYLKSFSILPVEHIEAHASLVPIQYKSLCALIVSGVDNRDNLFDFIQICPDYLNVPTTDQLFELMNTSTKEWIRLFILAIASADKIGTFDPVPVGMKKITRNNILYVNFKYNSIDYLVATKASTPGYIV
jgi:hypothetical protein